MASFIDLKSAISELNDNFRRPGLPALEFSLPLYDLKSDWTKTYPNADGPGVYVLLDGNQVVVYVGKASFSATIGSRLGNHIVRDSNGEPCVSNPAWESAHIRYISTIGLPIVHAFEAPAIEEFLITRLQPCPFLNHIGRKSAMNAT